MGSRMGVAPWGGAVVGRQPFTGQPGYMLALTVEPRPAEWWVDRICIGFNPYNGMCRLGHRCACLIPARRCTRTPS
jgi:hypothetical protein